MTPVLILTFALFLTLLAMLDRWLLPVSDPLTGAYRITQWSHEGCFLATPIHGGGTKKIYPLHMTRRSEITDPPPSWLLSDDITIERAWTNDPSSDAIVAKSFYGTRQNGDLMAKLIVTGWLGPRPEIEVQTLSDRERALVEQHRWDKRARDARAARRKD